MISNELFQQNRALEKFIWKIHVLLISETYLNISILEQEFKKFIILFVLIKLEEKKTSKYENDAIKVEHKIQRYYDSRNLLPPRKGLVF